ncbi:MAG TPA: aspartyl protease family protein [Steroidobacteraceae bacterium]|jgi:tetratricopeptide (TPR) repeat protein
MLTKRIRQMLFAAASVLLGTGISYGECKLQLLLVMPITMAGNQPLVTVKLNGMEAHLLMDTGAFFSFVSPEAARRAGLPESAAPGDLAVEGVGGIVRPDKAMVQDFTIGKQTLHRVDLLVYGDRFSANGVDGVLGQNFLRLGDIEIDLANGVAKLFKTSGCEHANLAYWAGSAQVGVLDILPTDQISPDIIADAQVNGTDIRVMFDTGSGASSLSLHAAKKAGVTPESPGVVSGGLQIGLGAAAQDSWIAPFKSFKLDSEETLNTRLRIGDLRTLPKDSDMLLGADFFLSHHVFIAYRQRRLFFTYNGGPVFDLRVRGAPPATVPATASPPVTSSAPTAPTANGAALTAADFDRRAQASIARNELPAAIADFDRAIAAESGNALYHLHRGEALARMGQVKQGLADVDQALRLQPQMTDALMFRAAIRIRNNNLDGARADFAAAEASAPGRFELPLEEANAYISTERYPMALDVLNRWIAAHPDDERRYDALSERCLVRGMLGKDLEAALSDCNTVRRNASSNSQVLYSRGIVQLRRREYAKAISDFSDTIELQPRFAAATYARGLARIAKGDKAAGDADLQSALALNPRVARVFHDLGLGP